MSDQPEKTKAEPIYSASLSIGDKEYRASGETLRAAIQGLKPEFYKAKGILKVKKGDKEAQRLLYIPQMRRLFGEFSSLSKEVLWSSMAKLLEQLLK